MAPRRHRNSQFSYHVARDPLEFLQVLPKMIRHNFTVILFEQFLDVTKNQHIHQGVKWEVLHLSPAACFLAGRLPPSGEDLHQSPLPPRQASVIRCVTDGAAFSACGRRAHAHLPGSLKAGLGEAHTHVGLILIPGR